MAEEGKAPAVGTCFEELAEAEEFEVYENYARNILDSRCQRTLEGLLGKYLPKKNRNEPEFFLHVFELLL